MVIILLCSRSRIWRGKNIPKIKEVAYTEESYDYEYRHVIGAIILETINNPKLGIFHDSPTKRFK